MLRAAVIAALCVAGGPALADPPKKIAVGAVESLGGQSDREVVKLVERALAARDDISLIGAAQIKRVLRRARKPHLQSCEGDTECLTTMGKTVGADLVVSVEVSGLGDVRLLHLKLIDPARGRAVRSTTAELGAGGLDPGALVRLLQPGGYRGRLALDISPEGAQVFIDGRRMAVAPVTAPLTLTVGTHALRITHPEYRDYVRFVDIGYAKQVKLAVDMRQLGVVSSEVSALGGRGSPRDRGETPWYGRWYVIAGAGAAVLAGSIAIWAATADGLEFDRERP